MSFIREKIDLYQEIECGSHIATLHFGFFVATERESRLRKNLPVTATEYLLTDGQSLVSKTDTKGRITYVNPGFIEASGFSEAELLGKAHNIVRHPDMPPEAFEDMWKTLQAGQAWTGIVKNRRKNGDFYWVVANVVTIRDGARTIGYMSVRTPPTREQVAQAEAIYRKFREGDARGLAIRNGKVVGTSVLARLAALRNVPIGRRLAIMLGSQAAVLAVLAAVVEGTFWRVLALLGAGFAAVAWIELQRSLVRPLSAATEAVYALAGGDLAHRCPRGGEDEMGQLLAALSQLNVNLTATVGDVRRNVSSIEGAIREIAAGNVDLAKRTESQAASIEQTAASFNQIGVAAGQAEESVQRADRVVASAATVAGQGGQAVDQVGSNMERISAGSSRIGDIISLIDGIAFQTGLLALNASVEAARAGEGGRGFAVVAGEVRALAQRSATAAREIKSLLEESAHQVAQGGALASQAGATMREVVASVQGAAAIMNDISRASREQHQGISRVGQAIGQLEAITRQNAALVEESASASTNVAQEATRLVQALSVFKFGSDR